MQLRAIDFFFFAVTFGALDNGLTLFLNLVFMIEKMVAISHTHTHSFSHSLWKTCQFFRDSDEIVLPFNRIYFTIDWLSTYQKVAKKGVKCVCISDATKLVKQISPFSDTHTLQLSNQHQQQQQQNIVVILSLSSLPSLSKPQPSSQNIIEFIFIFPLCTWFYSSLVNKT